MPTLVENMAEALSNIIVGEVVSDKVITKILNEISHRTVPYDGYFKTELNKFIIRCSICDVWMFENEASLLRYANEGHKVGALCGSCEKKIIRSHRYYE